MFSLRIKEIVFELSSVPCLSRALEQADQDLYHLQLTMASCSRGKLGHLGDLAFFTDFQSREYLTHCI